jgi:predicted cupin superfamily sugar epimerase
VSEVEAREIIAGLGLAPHPEGGHFREIYRRPPVDGGRSTMTSIYYLLAPGEQSAWHRLAAADEVWFHHAGDPLALRLSADGVRYENHLLGTDVARGQRPQVIVPAGCWQSAEVRGAWSLVGCAVSPGFEFSDFELAPPDFRPAPAS